MWESVILLIRMWTRLSSTDINEYSIGNIEHYVQPAIAASMWESVILLTIMSTCFPATVRNTSVLQSVNQYVNVAIWKYKSNKNFLKC